jgi:thymidine kinase
MGHIEVITGGMFSGKTEELIRRLKRALFAKQRVLLFKPGIDNRYSEEYVVSHNGRQMYSIPVNHAEDILNLVVQEETWLKALGFQPDEPFLPISKRVIGINEVQFLDDGIIEVCNKLADMGYRLILAGLDMDSRGNPFGPMPTLLAIAERVKKIHAICIKCGAEAAYSKRLIADSGIVSVGGSEQYEARCRSCFNERDSKD